MEYSWKVDKMARNKDVQGVAYHTTTRDDNKLIVIGGWPKSELVKVLDVGVWHCT